MNKETPLLLKPEMVLAVLDDRKDKTRRVVHKLLKFGEITEFGPSDTTGYDWHFRDKHMRWNDISHERLLQSCPYREVGDRLWVREPIGHGIIEPNFMAYKADDTLVSQYGLSWPSHGEKKGIPSIHMPRLACRLVLEITDVRVERVQDITEGDAMAEGIFYHNSIGGIGHDGYRYSQSSPVYSSAREAFFALIVTIHGPEFVALNPWLWVLTFKRT